MKKETFHGKMGEVISLLVWVIGTLVCEKLPVALTIFCAMAIHECGHLLAFLWLKEPVPAFQVGRLGLKLVASRPLSFTSQLWVALAGPATNLLCASLLLLLDGLNTPALLHLMMAFGNLLPIATLDGGRILDASLSICFSPFMAYRICAVVSLLSIVVLLLLSICTLWTRGSGGYLYFLSFSLFLEHIFGEENGIRKGRE